VGNGLGCAALLTEMTGNGFDYSACLQTSHQWRLGVVRALFANKGSETISTFNSAIEDLGAHVVMDPTPV